MNNRENTLNEDLSGKDFDGDGQIGNTGVAADAQGNPMQDADGNYLDANGDIVPRDEIVEKIGETLEETDALGDDADDDDATSLDNSDDEDADDRIIAALEDDCNEDGI